jgi:branched-chain amino acid transport system ATP-binding protein
MVSQIRQIIDVLHREGVAILLVEQNSTMALALADRAYVIDDGRIVHAAPARELEADTARLHQLLAV